MIENNEHWYVLDVNPEPWAIGPVGTARRNGKLSSFVGRNQQLDAYKEAVKEAIADQNPVMVDGRVRLTFFFWRNQATYTTPQARAHRKHEADVTNLQKSTEDALQGVLYPNDKNVSQIESILVSQGPDTQGLVIVKVEPFNDVKLDRIPESVMTLALKKKTRSAPSSNEWNGPDA